MDLHGKRVVVVGLGASGVAAARLCLRLGAEVVANDGKALSDLSPAARAIESLGIRIVAGDHEAARMTDADLVVVSPGVPPLAAVARAEAQGVPVWGEIELSFRALGDRAPVVAIGGTNGKSTTTALVGALLTGRGLHVFVGGNLGEPLAGHVDEAFDAVVLEISSFQMERVHAFRPHVCALLNVTADHLDRYSSFEHYAHAKGNAFARQTEDDWAIVPVADALCAAQAARGRGNTVTFGPGGNVDVQSDALTDRRSGDRYDRRAIALNGAHNAANVAAAIACVTPFGVGAEIAREVLQRFAGLPHRMAFVASRGGVRYYDDSKGTNVGASVTALVGLDEPRAVLICGGRDKGGSYAPLAEALAARGRAAVLLGESADAIARAVDARLPVHRASSMPHAVELAAQAAQRGDAVLLSPACSSFDMFRDYAERGDAFARAVLALPEDP